MTDNVYIDYLTGVYNRKWLYEQFVLNMKSEGCSVLYMDLDNFKSVNDLYGHVEGDRVLKYFADSVRSVERDGFPVRMSGDEFVLILDKPVSAEGITEIYNRLTQKVKEGIREVPSLSFITVSAGAHTSRDGTELQEILDDADAAMYQAKRDGKSRCVFFEDIRQKIIMEKTIADEAPKALKEGRFDILFDPAINLQSSLPEQTRVAVVQKNLDGGLSDSESFRYVLEENGFIRTLDLSLLRRLFKAVSGMEKDVFEKSVSESRNIRLSFEVSELLIIDKTFFDTLKGLLAEYHIDPAIIDISVSEKAFAGRDVELLISGMKRISGIGITMTIKNFGDNFASIRYLTMIPVSTIRLDPGWLRKSLTDKRERKILKSVIRLVKDLHLTVIAMGDIDKEGID